MPRKKKAPTTQQAQQITEAAPGGPDPERTGRAVDLSTITFNEYFKLPEEEQDRIWAAMGQSMIDAIMSGTDWNQIIQNLGEIANGQLLGVAQELGRTAAECTPKTELGHAMESAAKAAKTAATPIKTIPMFAPMFDTVHDLAATTQRLMKFAASEQVRQRMDYFKAIIPFYRDAIAERPRGENEDFQEYQRERIQEADRRARAAGALPAEETTGADSGTFPALDMQLFSQYTDKLAPFYNGDIMRAMLAARPAGETDPYIKRNLKINNVSVTTDYVKEWGPGTAKVFTWALRGLTAQNSSNSSTPRLRVVFPTKQYAAICGVSVAPEEKDTPEEIEKEEKRVSKNLENFKAKLKKQCQVLYEADFSWTESIKGRGRSYDRARLISKYHVDSDKVIIDFSQDVADYFVNLPISQDHPALYKIDERKENAYFIGRKLQEHYSIENNVIRDTERKLTVKTLLNVTTIPKYEDLVGKRKTGSVKSYGSRWEDRIKEPFERALDELCQVGFMKSWHYTAPGTMEPLPDEQAYSITDYFTFESLGLYFELTEFEEHADRFQEITARKEEEKKKFAQCQKRKKEKPATK